MASAARQDARMAKAADYWMNVDVPTKRCVLHRPGVAYAVGKRETPFKGIGHVKRDGGWLGFASEQEARSYFESALQGEGFGLVGCARCWYRFADARTPPG